MTRDEFIELIDGFENEPFIITKGGMSTPPLKYVRILSDSVKVMSNGKPAVYQFSDIGGLSFDIEQNNRTDNDYWIREYNAAKNLISYTRLEVADRRDEIKKNIKNTIIAKDWARLDAMLNDAKKNHNITEKTDRIIYECNSITERLDCREIRIFMGMVYIEAKEYEKAVTELVKGGDFYNAAFCAQMNNEEKMVKDYLKKHALTDHYCDKNSLSVLFYLLSKYKDGSGALMTAKALDLTNAEPLYTDIVYSGMLIVYFQYNSFLDEYNFSQKSKTAAISDIIISLSNIIKSEETEKINFQNKLPSAKDAVFDKDKSSEKKDKVYYGTIKSFIKFENNGYGWIKNSVNPSMYFNIRQVEDENLRNSLYNEEVNNIKVSFTLGIGKEGNKAADHIRPIENIIIPQQISEGILTEFGNYNKFGVRYGIVINNNKEYLIMDEAIIDPVLRLYLNDVFPIREVCVKFIWKTHKQNRIVLKAWINQEKEPDLFNDYKKSISDKEYNEFLEEIKESGNTDKFFCPFAYKELPPWNNTKDENVQTIYTTNADTHEIFIGINELIAKGTYYLTKEKDLVKAESCFKKVLERKPEKGHINTAVCNLLTIYKQDKQNDKTDEAFALLEKYRTTLEKDKYNNQLIDLLDKTEKYDRMAAVLKEVIPNSGKSKSHRVKQLIRCYIKLENLSEAKLALKRYRNIIDDLSFNNYYISVLESSGNFNETESFLSETISKTHKIEHKLNYMNKLALFYQKNKKNEQAIEIYEQWKKFYHSNRINITTSAAAAGISNMEMVVDRNLCILYYISGQKEKSKSIATELLRKNSNDSIANQILSDTYTFQENQTYALSDDDDEYFDYESNINSKSQYLEWLLDNIDYKRSLFGNEILKNIENNKYIGDVNQAKTDIESVYRACYENIMADRNSNILLSLAKIIQQFIDVGKNNNYLSTSRFNLYVGRSLLFRAEAYLNETSPDRDSLRFYYFLSLRYLSRSKGDIKSFFIAINMLYNSFFLSDNELASVNRNDISNELNITPPAKYNESILSVKDLMIYTFELENKYKQSRIGDQHIVRSIIEGIFNSDIMKEKFKRCISEMLNEDQEMPDTLDKYTNMWNKANREYESIYNNLKRMIGSVNDNINNQESLKQTINRLNERQHSMILNTTDAKYLKSLVDILNEFVKLNYMYVVDDREDKLKCIISLCRDLDNAIRNTPTDFSYEVILESVIELNGNATRLINKLYDESKPVLEVYPESTAFYKENEDKKTRLTIYVENKGNVQKTDISDMTLTLKSHNMRIVGNPEHTFSTVQGGKKEEYTIMLSFTDAEKDTQLFEIDFSFNYGYYKGLGEQVKQKFSDSFQINLLSINSFQKIDDKFNQVVEGGAVEDDNMFYGRKLEIEHIIHSLDPGQGKVLSHRGIYMYGQKRAGKSSIMSKLIKKIDQDFPSYIIVDLGSFGERYSEEYDTWIRKQISKRLKKAIKKKYLEIYSEIKEMEEFEDIMMVISDKLSDKTVMIMADEFTYIYEAIKKKNCNKNFPHFWKALLQNYNISSIIIGQDSMVNFVEEYANDFACMMPMFVGYLAEEDAKKFIDEPIRDNGKTRYDPDAIDMIYNLTAGSAYLIAVFCHQLVTFMNSRGASRITKTTLDIFINSWFFNPTIIKNSQHKLIFDPQLNDPSLFENEKEINADNKIILSYIAKNCNLNKQIKISEIDCKDKLSKNSDEYQKQLIEQLIKRQVLIKEGEFCRIWVDLLRYYLIKEGNY